MSGDRAEGPILSRTYAEPLTAGRGRLIRRATPPQLIQVGHFAAVPR